MIEARYSDSHSSKTDFKSSVKGTQFFVLKLHKSWVLIR